MHSVNTRTHTHTKHVCAVRIFSVPLLSYYVLVLYIVCGDGVVVGVIGAAVVAF